MLGHSTLLCGFSLCCTHSYCSKACSSSSCSNLIWPCNRICQKEKPGAISAGLGWMEELSRGDPRPHCSSLPDLPAGRTGGECRLEEEGRFWRLAVLEAWRDNPCRQDGGSNWLSLEVGPFQGRGGWPHWQALRPSEKRPRHLYSTVSWPRHLYYIVLFSTLASPSFAAVPCPALPCPALPCTALYFPQVQLVAEAGTVLPVTRRVQSL